MIVIRRIHIIIFLMILIVLGIITHFFKEEINQTFLILKSLM